MALMVRSRETPQTQFKLWKAFRNMIDLWTECSANVEAGKALVNAELRFLAWPVQWLDEWQTRERSNR
jgi:hypothetical protein